ncbi:MAG: ATP-binding protein, partial [Holophaga sp.]
MHQIELEMQNEELRQKQVELDLALQMYFDLYELAPVGYCSLSEHGLILRANLTAAKLLGAVRGSMINQRISYFIHPMDQDIYYRHNLHLVKTGEPQAFDLRLRRKDKTTFWAHLEASLAQNPGDHSTCRLVLSDITERKETEAQQRHLETLLQQSQKMESLGILAGGVAHDMNNVLGAILGLASTNLGTVPPESPAHHGFATIIRAAERGGQTVKGLLSFARQTPAEERHLDMNTLIQEAARLLAHTTLAKIHLELDLAADLRPIRGDASALAHALMNLCVNAVDAMPPNGTLTLRTRNVDNAWIEVLVEDTGAGMSKQVLAKAMDPFFTTKEVGKGTGLGLALVYRTIEAHRGQIDIQSAPEMGTRVSLRLPICEPWDQTTAPAAKSLVNSDQRSLMVLVVDDDELIRCTMAPLLELLGHRAECVDSGEAALE